MDVNRSNTAGGSLHISSEVIEKIAVLAAKEIEGVVDVTTGNAGMKTFLNKIAPQNPILIEMKDDVADVTVHLSIKYGTSVPALSEKVQKNIKSSVQNMTHITVAKVNVVIVGIQPEEQPG